MAELYHVGLTVKNLDRSVAFYRDIAGMTETWRYDVTGKEHGMLTNNPNATLKGVHLTAGQSPFSYSNTNRAAVLLWISITTISAVLISVST